MTDNKSLYDFKREMLDLISQLELMGGEIDESTEAYLADLTSNISQKIRSIDFVIERLSLLADHYKSKAQEASNVSKQLKCRADYLTQSIKDYMAQADISEIIAEDVVFKRHKTAPSIDVLDESKIPARYVRETITTSVDKVAIKKEMLENATQIPGVQLKQGWALRKVANKSIEGKK